MGRRRADLWGLGRLSGRVGGESVEWVEEDDWGRETS